MLHDLTRQDWLSLLELPEARVPEVLILRGTRALKYYYQEYQRYFTNVLEIVSPNVIFEDLFIGERNGVSVGYASVYGAPMAAEVVHLFGVLGASLVIQTGCFGALTDHVNIGDSLVVAEAYCGEGASQYYRHGGKVVRATITKETPFLRETAFLAHQGRLYTTSALLAESREDVERWAAEGFAGVDMETAATFAVAEYFGMDRASILYVFDNPARREHILLDDEEKRARRAAGNRQVIDLALALAEQWAVGSRQ